jgi:hypothetical protein
MATYRSSAFPPEPPEKTPEERRQWLADLHKRLDEAEAKAEAEWDLSKMTNEPIGESWEKVEQPPKPKRGPRGGRYTDSVTKDGVPYRRYF